MTCLLIAATAKEIEPFLDHYRRGDNPAEIDVLLTGVGLTSTTYSLTRQIMRKRPDIILQAGVAGCYDLSLPLASVFTVDCEILADQAVRESDEWKTMFDLGLVKPNQPPFHNGLLPNPHKRLLKKTGLPAVRAISVNQVTTLPSVISHYLEKFSPTLESMEGAALHFAARMEGIPFVQLRATSNYIGERDKSRWKIREAIQRLNKELIRISGAIAGPKNKKKS